MRWKKTIAWSLAAVAAFLLAINVLLWLGVRTAAARRAVSDYVGGLTGLPVTVESLSVGILPTPSMQLGGLTIAQPPGFALGPLLELDSASVSVPWSVVFGGDPVLRTVAISGATVRAGLAADGADNWSEVIERLSKLGGEGEPRWSVGRLDVENSAFEFQDAATGAQWRLTAITVGAQSLAPAIDFPVELRLGGVHGANTFHFGLTGQGLVDPAADRFAARDLALRGWVGGEPLPLAGIELEGGVAVASYDGKTGLATIRGGAMALAGIRSEFALSGRNAAGHTSLDISLSTEPFSPRVAATAFGHPLPATADPQVFQTLQLAIQGHLERELLRLDPVEGRLDDTGFSGHAIPQQRLIRLRADHIDIDRYLAPEQADAQTAGDPEATLEAALADLGRLDVDAEIRIAEARVAGARLRDALLKIERDDAVAP